DFTGFYDAKGNKIYNKDPIIFIDSLKHHLIDYNMTGIIEKRTKWYVNSYPKHLSSGMEGDEAREWLKMWDLECFSNLLTKEMAKSIIVLKK
ncbi:MAG: hypothetical protein ACFFDN_25130, partial [Candidatus Hodarchaeota archaeon]